MPWEPLPGTPTEPRDLGVSVARVVAALGGPSPDALAVVFGRWPSVVGPRLADHAVPVRLHDGELVVEVDDPAWVAEVRFDEAVLLERVERLLGRREIVRITVRVSRDAHR